MAKFFFEKKFFGLKIFKKTCFWAKNGEKMAKSKILVENFFVGIDLECFETYFKTKSSNSKIFLIAKFFLGLSHFFISVDSSSKIWKKNWSSGTKKSKLQRIWRGSFLYTWHWIWKKIIFFSFSPDTKNFSYFSSLWTVHLELKKIEVTGRKN